MRSHLISLFAFTGLGCALAITNAGSLPDGIYIESSYQNGTKTIKLWDQSDTSEISVKTKQRKDVSSTASIQKRDAFCWGTPLDHAGVDLAVNGLKNWAGVGHSLTSPPGQVIKVSIIANGMRVYYCINEPNYTGNLDIPDVAYALGQMDAVCVPYTASYWQWSAGPEIVGKANQNTPVCCGVDGSYC